MAQLATTPRTCFASLKTKQRALRDGFSTNLSLRVHRALSWLNRAEMADGDHDAAFIFYWIAFNAAYARELDDIEPLSERAALGEFFQRLTDLDRRQFIYAAIWQRFPQEIRALLHNKYVFQPFWKYQNHMLGHEDWEERFAASRRRATTALASSDTQTVLMILFDRLYVLRNQLVHGGATWNSQVNRDQVRDGARIMALLVPLFVDLMMDNPEVVWGAPHYPVVE